MNKGIKTNKVLSLILAIAMIATMVLPTSVFAVTGTPAEISTTLDGMTFYVDKSGEADVADFTVTTVANDDLNRMVMGKFTIKNATATDISSLEYYGVTEGTYLNLPMTNDGEGNLVGEFGPVGTGFPMIDATSQFKVTFAKAGDYEVEVSVVTTDGTSTVLASCDATVTVIGYADYTDLNTAISTAEGYILNSALYTQSTINTLKGAVEDAKDINSKLYADDTSAITSAIAKIEDAIDNLVEVTDVTFSATAVTDDVNANYAKANKIIVVFSKPLADGAELLLAEKSNIDATVTKINNSVYSFALATDHSLGNGLTLEIDSEEEILTAAGEAINPCSSLVVGNLTGVADLVKPTEMTATIVKASDKPDVNAGDKIVFVFNAPIKDKSSIVFTNGKEADVVTSTANTVYELILVGDEGYTESTSFTYDSITVTGLNGSFGSAVAPKALVAVAIDNDGTAKTENDEIIVIFDRPTNAADDISAITELGTDAKAVWSENDTKLTITVGEDATVENGMTIDLSTLGIMDKYNMVGATQTSIVLAGSFGKAIAPRVVKAVAVDNDGTALTEGDSIIVYFDRSTNSPLSETLDGELEGATYEWLDAQTLKITLGSTKIKNPIDISKLRIQDLDETISATGLSGITLEGSFGVAIQPTLLTITAISKSGNGTATAGDEIHLSFNVKMKEDALDLINDFDFDNGHYGSTGASVRWATGEEYKDYSAIIITLGDEPRIVPGETTISIKKTLSEQSDTKQCDMVSLQNKKVRGTFGTTVVPELLSASIVKTKTEVGPQNGDKIVLMFNVPTNKADISNLIKVNNKSLGTGYEGKWSDDNTIYTIELGSAPTVEGGDTIVFDNDGTLKDINGQKQAKSNAAVISGSFGKEAEPVGISPSKVTATIVKAATTAAGAQEDDKIVFAFNVVTNGSALMQDFFEAQGELFGTGLQGGWNSSNTIYTLVLGKNATIKDGAIFTFTSQAGIQDKDEINSPVSLTCTLVGSFGVEVKPMSVSPSLLDAVIIKGSNTVGATKGDKIQFVFNMAINNADLFTALGGETVFGAGAQAGAENNIYTITLGTGANIPDKFDIATSVGLKDAAEFSNPAEITNIVLTGSFGSEVKPVTAAPTLFKAVIVKATDTVGPQKGDKIQLVFNMAINNADLFTALGGTTVFGEDAFGSAENNVYTITLGTGATIPSSFNISSDVGLKDASGYSGSAVISNITLVGSFGIVVNPVATKPSLKNAVIIKDSGKLGIHKGDKIVLIFNVATNGKDDNINLLNNIDFPGRNDETLGTDPLGKWLSDIEYEITLGEGAAISEVVSENAIIKFNHHNTLMDKAKITAASEIEVYSFEGSFGIAPIVKLEKATIVKADDNKMAKAQEGDMIILSFSSKTNGVDIAEKLNEDLYGDGVSGEWSNDDTIYTITLGTNPKIADNANIVLPENTGLKGFDDGAYAANTVKLEGSFGKVSTPVVISAIAYSDEDNDYIDITFNISTNEYSENKSQGQYLFVEETRNILGDYTVNWDKGPNVLTIVLGNNHSFATDSEIEFVNGIVKDADELGVLANDTKVSNVNGELRKPYVVSVVANYDAGTGVETLTVTFSSKTNKKAADTTDISAQSSSLGIGATATWTDSKTMVITLGTGRTISVNGTGGILLNGLGITNGFDTNEVVGQYSITSGSLKEDVLKTVDARVNRKAKEVGEGTDDFLTVTFNAPTNMYGKVLGEKFNMSDIEAYIVSTHTFGTGAVAEWESASKLVITLGTESTFVNEKALAEGAAVTFKDLKFANGLGTIVEETIKVTGSFDGRETKLEILNAKVEGEYTVATVTMNKQDLDYDTNAIVTFVIWDKDGKLVTDINAMKIDVNAVDTIELQSKFATKEAGKVDVYVTDAYIDVISAETPTFNLLADTVTSSVAAGSGN